MEKAIPIGRTFFAVALLGLGVEHFIFQEFVTGRAPAWPASIPGGWAWAYLTGALFIGVGIAILIGWKARLSAIGAGLLIFVWALLRHVPLLATDALLSATWTTAGKALTFFGGLFAIAATFPGEETGRFASLTHRTNLERAFIRLGRICLGLFLVLTGIQHFMFTEFVASLIPAWFPGDAVFWTWFAGVALVAGGVGLIIPQTARVAALLSGLMVFSWFWIVHVPRTFVSTSDGIAVFEALAVSGIAFVLAGALGRPSSRGAPFIR